MEKYSMRGTRLLVEAAQIGVGDIDTIANWCGGQIVEEKDALTGEATEGMNLKTPTGRKRASNGDFVVKHGDTFQVFTPSQFAAKFGVAKTAQPVVEPKRTTTQDPFEGMTRFNEGPKP